MPRSPSSTAATVLRPARADGTAEPPPWPARPLIVPVLHALLPLVILGLWAWGLEGVRLRDITDLGLISVMPRSAIVLLIVLTVSFCVSLASRPLKPWIPLAHVLVLVVMLYGVTALLESEPRGAVVYRHVGIIDYIIRNESVDPSIDAYFNWPGFFALAALFSEAAGFATPLSLGRWAPFAFNLMFLPMLIAIFRWASDDPRVRWLGVWVFYSANWVGQDYLSPQAAGYTIWLTMLALLLTWFTPRPSELAARPSLRALRRALELRRVRARIGRWMATDNRVIAHHRRAGLAVLAVGLFAAVVTGHQLTPFFALLGVTALALFAGLEFRVLPVIMVVLLGAWLSYMTTAYLAGNFDTVVAAPVGSTSENLNQNVTARISGSGEHEFIVRIRLLSSAAIWLLACAGVARRLFARQFDIALVLIAGTTLVLPLIQPYGGEMLLRVFLFALPAVAFFIASLAFPTPAAGRDWRTLAAVATVCCALVATFQFTRYGNERLDHFTRGDVAAVDALYRIAPPGASLIGSDNLPWRNRGYASYDYRTITDLRTWQVPRPDPAAIARDIEAYAKERGGAYVILTRSTKISAALLYGKGGVLERLVEQLRSSPSVEKLYHARDGDVFYIKA